MSEKVGDNGVLFLCGHYGMSQYSNSICVKNLAEEFVRRGKTVYVYAWCSKSLSVTDENINGVNVHYVRESTLYFFTEKYSNNKSPIAIILFLILRVVRYVQGIFIYPNIDPFNSRYYYKLSKKLIDNNRINTIVATYTPYDGIAAGIKLKKRYGNKIRLVTYHLDLMNSPANTGLIKKVKLYLNKKAILEEQNYADKVLLPLSVDIVSSKKVEYVGFPLFVQNVNEKRNSYRFSDDVINISYVGSLSKANRDPSYAISLLEGLNRFVEKQILIHIWGSLDKDCQRITNSKSVIYHGIVNNEETMDILKRSDFLLNISNEVTYRMIPSKIFQYFAAKKPILNFIKNREDKSIPFFIKYNHSLMIHEFMGDVLCQQEEIKEFIKVYYGKTIDLSHDSFIESTPSYICDVIEKS